MSILKVAKAPAIVVPPTITVMEAVERMRKANTGAVIVMDIDQIRGVFTERDVMLRVVAGRRDPDRTMVKDVMTINVVTVDKNARAEDVVKLMWEKQVRHLPVVHVDGSVAGLVEIRDLFHEQFEDLNQQLDALEHYIGADGPGG